MTSITDEEIYLLTKFYQIMKETGHWVFLVYDNISRSEYRIFESLGNRGLILKTPSGSHYMSTRAILILSSNGVANEIIDNFMRFLTNYDGKLRWSRQELEKYCENMSLKYYELAFAINFGKHFSFFKTLDTFGSPLPVELTITVKGEEYAKNPEAFVSYIEFNNELFQRDFNDKIVLDWLINTSKGTEDYNVEFKEKAHYAEIREVVVSFANHESGILGIGFDDEANLKGIENLDEERRRIYDAIKDFNNVRIETKIIQDESENKGILLMIPKTKEPLFLGDNVLTRIGTSKKNLSKKEILDLAKQKNATQCGHLWLKALRFFKYSKHIEDK